MPAKIIIPIGTRFGKLVVQSYIGRGLHGRLWACLCDCGNWATPTTGALRSGHTKSCGCYQKEAASNASTKHGHGRRKKKSPEYGAWHGTIMRCEYPNTNGYANYGGRGLKVCRGLRHSFPTFLRIVGSRPSAKHSLDRKDNDGNYSCGECEECLSKGWPMNLRWATRIEQQNNLRSNKRLTIDGATKTVAEWAREFNVPYGRIKYRLKRGDSPKHALTSPRETHPQPLTFNGRTQSQAAWAKEVGIDPKSLTTRLVNGWTVEEAVTTPRREYTRLISHGGRTLCISDWARETGIDRRAIDYRLRVGWSIERALTEPLDPTKNRRRAAAAV